MLVALHCHPYAGLVAPNLHQIQTDAEILKNQRNLRQPICNQRILGSRSFRDNCFILYSTPHRFQHWILGWSWNYLITGVFLNQFRYTSIEEYLREARRNLLMG